MEKKSKEFLDTVKLSPRGREVIEMVYAGKTNKEIGEFFSISASRVQMIKDTALKLIEMKLNETKI